MGTSSVVRYMENYTRERLIAYAVATPSRAPLPRSGCLGAESFPDREKFGLAHQMRRAAVSIPANIAEGFGKRSPAEKGRFLNIAEGSLEECRYYLILAQDRPTARTGSKRRGCPASRQSACWRFWLPLTIALW